MPIKFITHKYTRYVYNFGPFIFDYDSDEAIWDKKNKVPIRTGNKTVAFDFRLKHACFTLKTKLVPKKVCNYWEFEGKKIYGYANITHKSRFAIDAYLFSLLQDDIFIRESLKRKRYKLPDWSNNGT